MFRKSGHRFSEKNMRKLKEAHVPEKRAPVFRKEHAQAQGSACSGKAGTGFPKRTCASSRKRMFRKSGHRFSEKNMRKLKEAHVPEKRAPVFRKEHAPIL